MAQINTNIAYQCRGFVNTWSVLPNSFIEPLVDGGLDDWEKRNISYSDGVLVSDAIDRKKYALIRKNNFKNIVKIEFDWKIEAIDKNFMSVAITGLKNYRKSVFGDDNSWKHISVELPKGDYKLFWYYHRSDNDDEDGRFYIKNLKITVSKNGTYLKNKILKVFQNILNISKYEIKIFKIPSDEVEISKSFNPIKDNFDGWVQYDENAKAYVEDGILKFSSIEDKDILYSAIYYFWIRNITKVEFDWKVECNENDSALTFYTFRRSARITGSVDWEHKVLEFKGETGLIFGFFKMKEDSNGEGTGYFKNIIVTTSNKIFKNGNYIRTKVSRFPIILNQSNFKVSRFLTTLNQSNFIIKSFTNQSKNHFYRLGRDLTVPPKRIIFKNFED